MRSRHELARAIHDTSNIRGEFLLRSGATSTEYFDKYLFESQPSLLREIAAAMAPLVPEDTELLAGLEMGGIPLATMLSSLTGIPAVFVRKKAKTYGTCKLAEGADIEGRRLLVIEDVITSGGQAVISSGDLRERGALVDTVLCVIDRQAGGSEALAAADLTLQPLFTMTELKAAAKQA